MEKIRGGGREGEREEREGGRKRTLTGRQVKEEKERDERENKTRMWESEKQEEEKREEEIVEESKEGRTHTSSVAVTEATTTKLGHLHDLG